MHIKNIFSSNLEKIKEQLSLVNPKISGNHYQLKNKTNINPNKSSQYDFHIFWSSVTKAYLKHRS